MRWTLSLPFVAMLLAVSGGGSGQRLTHDQYLDALRKIEASAEVRDVEWRFSQLGGSVTGEQCRTGSRTFADEVQGIVDAVDRLRPPPDAEQLQRRLVTAGGETAAALSRLADDVASGRVACGMAWNLRAYGLPSTAEAERVLAEFARRGYLLRWNSSH